jgi:NTP pyrophosphatase (non-canonical NTP hydrolase)
MSATRRISTGRSTRFKLSNHEAFGGSVMLSALKAQFEQASVRYADANGLKRDPDWFVLKLQEEIGELTQIWNKLSGRGRRQGRSDEELRQALADETADVLGHILLFAEQNNLDLAAAIERKWLFRPDGS